MTRQPPDTDALRSVLFAEPGVSLYAVLDGASCLGLRQMLWETKPEHCCLYSGDLENDVADRAPYLVRLERDGLFLQWVLDEGWGNHWGIFAAAAADLRTMRKHFRTFLMVGGPDGKVLYFRYYDPRVLRVFLPTCTPQELATMFGPVLWYLAEDGGGGGATRLRLRGGVFQAERVALPLPGGGFAGAPAPA